MAEVRCRAAASADFLVRSGDRGARHERPSHDQADQPQPALACSMINLGQVAFGTRPDNTIYANYTLGGVWRVYTVARQATVRLLDRS